MDSIKCIDKWGFAGSPTRSLKPLRLQYNPHRSPRGDFADIDHHRDKLGAGYTCSLQAMSGVSWASPAFSAKRPRAAGRPVGHDYSQRACGPSDTSQGLEVQRPKGSFSRELSFGLPND